MSRNLIISLVAFDIIEETEEFFMAERRRYVTYIYRNAKTGAVMQSGGIYVMASDTHEAEGLAYAELTRHPRCSSTSGVELEVECNDW